MKPLWIALFGLVLALGLTPDDSWSKSRLGGGKSVGAQRQATPPQKAAPAAQQQGAQAPAQAAPQPAGGSRWLGPLAGLAAGLGLGWLFAQGGFGSVLGALAMALVAGLVVFMVIKLLAGRRREGAPLQYAGAGAGRENTRSQYAGLGNETVAAPPPSQMPEVRSEPNYRSQFVPNIPAGFDVEGFLAQAKRNFIRLQDANDRGEVEALREVTTPDMFESLKSELAGRGEGKHQTDVVTLNASLLELVTEGTMHWASVRFAGTIREDAAGLPEAFEEIWHLQKPVDGSSGWLLAGIQQTS